MERSVQQQRLHILALIPLPAATQAALASIYTVHDATATPPVPWEDIAAVVTNGTTGLSAGQMERMPALRIACAFGAGYEAVDLAAAARRGVVVTNAPGANDETVADHALGFLLALSRGYGALTSAVRACGWHGLRAARPTLHGATLGIIGMGRIGKAIAQRAVGFGMQVRYCTRNPRDGLPYQHEPSLLALASASDYLVAACPGGPATHHIVDGPVLAALGPEGFFVNVARGSVVDTDALVQALRTGSIAGAGLDVFEYEPEVPAALRALDNVLLTPHMAGRSPASQAAQTTALLASLADCFAGRVPATAIAPC